MSGHVISYSTAYMLPKLNNLFCDFDCAFYRQLCLLLNAEDIYGCCSEILTDEDDVGFASRMIQTLSSILLTSSELFELRSLLKELSTEVFVFSICESPKMTYLAAGYCGAK